MVASNPIARPVHSRIFNLTPAGSRLAQYLEYVKTNPTVSADINFAEIGNPPDGPGQQPRGIVESELKRLYAELEQCQEEMFKPTCPNWRYDELRHIVREIREEIAGYEGE